MAPKQSTLRLGETALQRAENDPDFTLETYLRRSRAPAVLTDVDAAHESWGANCGPTALAAALGLSTVGAVREFVQPFRGFMAPTDMREAVRRAEKAGLCKFTGRSNIAIGDPEPWPEHLGLVRIQFEGPWCAPGVNPRVAYRYTHFVAAHRGPLAAELDIRLDAIGPNEVLIYDGNVNAWLPLALWSAWCFVLFPKRATGWRPVNTIELTRRTGP